MTIKRTAIDELLGSYPRARPRLSDRHRQVYIEEYRANRGGQGILYGLTRWLESWMHHRIVAERWGESLLELGAGSLNHVPYESADTIYDCIEPFVALYEKSPHRARVKTIYADISEVPDSARYDRVCSVAVLEHLSDLPSIVAQAALCLNNRGRFQAGIPTEGGVLWGLAWRWTTGLSYKLRTGLDYGALMRHEHVNSASEIEAVVAHFFREVKVSRFPLPVFHLSFYSYIEAADPLHEVCESYLENAQREGL